MATGLCLKRQSQGESELVVQGPQCDQLTGRQENISDPSQVAAPGSQLQEALPISPAEFRGKEQGHCGTAGCPHRVGKCCCWGNLNGLALASVRARLG